MASLSFVGRFIRRTDVDKQKNYLIIDNMRKTSLIILQFVCVFDEMHVGRFGVVVFFLG